MLVNCIHTLYHNEILHPPPTSQKTSQTCLKLINIMHGRYTKFSKLYSYKLFLTYHPFHKY